MRNICILLIQSVLLFLSFIETASAGVVVFDNVVEVSSSVKLKVLTKGKFFSEGGRLVKIYLNGKLAGTALSGGDGYAFMKYQPDSAGIKLLKAESGDDVDEGTLLVTAKDDRILLIEIEKTSADFPFSSKPAKDSAEVLLKLSKKFRIIYLTTLMGVDASKKLLKESGFPPAPVFKWEGAEMFDELREQGVKLYAVIASPGVISEAADIDKRYSFEETEDATEVKDWKDLLKHLDMNKVK